MVYPPSRTSDLVPGPGLASPPISSKHKSCSLPSAERPSFNPDEAIWDWIREDVTTNICLGTTTKVRTKVDAFFDGLAERTTEVKQRCRRDLQAQADALVEATSQLLAQNKHADLTLESA